MGRVGRGPSLPAGGPRGRASGRAESLGARACSRAGRIATFATSFESARARQVGAAIFTIDVCLKTICYRSGRPRAGRGAVGRSGWCWAQRAGRPSRSLTCAARPLTIMESAGRPLDASRTSRNKLRVSERKSPRRPPWRRPTASLWAAGSPIARRPSPVARWPTAAARTPPATKAQTKSRRYVDVNLAARPAAWQACLAIISGAQSGSQTGLAGLPFNDPSGGRSRAPARPFAFCQV